MAAVQGSYPIRTLYPRSSGRPHAGHAAPTGRRASWTHEKEPALQPRLVPAAAGVPQRAPSGGIG